MDTDAARPRPLSRRPDLGRAGEDAAAAHVARLGWRVLARNWRPADASLRGELDLVAVDGDALVVCEVKTRSGVAAGHPAAAVTPTKLRRLRTLTRAWLRERPGSHATVRVDVIAVTWPPVALAPSIDHRRDVRA